MSNFNVHEWNYKRRLAENDDRIYTGQSSERQEQALEDLASAIEELEMSGVFDDGNKAVEFMLNKAYNMLSKKLNIDSDLNEIEKQFEVRAFVVMLGKGMQLGPAKIFRNKEDAVAYAAEEKRTYEERFGEKLTTQVLEIPMG